MSANLVQWEWLLRTHSPAERQAARKEGRADSPASGVVRETCGYSLRLSFGSRISSLGPLGSQSRPWVCARVHQPFHSPDFQRIALVGCCTVKGSGPASRKFAIFALPPHTVWRTPNVLFFRSTGTSNARGYPGLWCPTRGYARRVNKSTDRLSPVHVLLEQDAREESDEHFQAFEALLLAFTQLYAGSRHDRVSRAYATLSHLCQTYFTYWWQLQLSVSLRGWWEKPDKMAWPVSMDPFRTFVLSHDWDAERGSFVRLTTAFPDLVVPDSFPCRRVFEVNLNDWARLHQAVEPSSVRYLLEQIV